MKTLPPTTTEPNAPAVADDLVTIKIAFLIPNEYPAVPLLYLDSPLLLMTYAQELQWLLEQEQLADDGVAWQGAPSDGLITFQTRRRADTLKLVLGWRDRVMLARCFSSVAWKDGVVSTWRIVAYDASRIQFEAFLAPERDQARTDIMERMKQMLSILLPAQE
jgi:hypothetical protein